eukprot:scaffold64_cov338-Pavlova_lutheri.AAC.81
MADEYLHHLMGASGSGRGRENAQAKLLALERRMVGQAAPPTPACPENRSHSRHFRSAMDSPKQVGKDLSAESDEEITFGCDEADRRTGSSQKRKGAPAVEERSLKSFEREGHSPDMSSPKHRMGESGRHVVRTISDYFDKKNGQDSHGIEGAIERKEAELQEIFDKKLAEVLNRHKKEAEQWKQEKSDLQRGIAELERAREIREDKEADLLRAHQKLEERACKVAAELAVEAAEAERRECRLKVCQVSCRLGTITYQRTGTVFTESWEEGEDFRVLRGKQRELTLRREVLEGIRKANKRRLPPPGAAGEKASEAVKLQWISPQEYVCNEEIYKGRLALMRREEDALTKELERLMAEKHCHLRELKRVKDEDNSLFNMHPILNDRYVLLNLLGKGGFSEVYKALDLKDLTVVACKIHQLNLQWSESRKQSYVKHAIREYNIHKALHHPNIVQLLDIFEIDADTFGTILEYCEGGDLDNYLKKFGTVSEKESRAIAYQLLNALCYIQQPEHRVIHYDLKPANILFDQTGQLKITDFGLSKVQEHGLGSMFELTSQGAGTYWYLPPECFETGPNPALISSKVDVWSVGIILYQILFGKRPFGHEYSQEKILREDAVRKEAHHLEFPQRPSLSQDCKQFIQACLTYKQSARPDVRALLNHSFLSFSKTSKT